LSEPAEVHKAGRGRPSWPSPAIAVLAGTAVAALVWIAVPRAPETAADGQRVPVSTAPQAAPGLRWADLRAEHARVLAPLRDAWDSLEREQQDKWVELAALFPRLAADERALVQQRMGEWARMSADDRRRARLQFRQASTLTPEQRLERWQAYQNLPPEQRQALLEQAVRDAPKPAVRTRPVAVPSKSTVVEAPPASPQRPVTQALVQAAPGATTKPLLRGDEPPLHQQTGLPKLAATPEFVDRSTLLPRRGAQAAHMRDPWAAVAIVPGATAEPSHATESATAAGGDAAAPSSASGATSPAPTADAAPAVAPAAGPPPHAPTPP
jgi:hypothetical protein